MLAFDTSLTEFFYVSKIVLYCFIDSFSIGVAGFGVGGVRFVNWPCFSEVYSIYKL